MRESVTAYLLAAGEGRRFGSSKPLAEFHGRTVLDRVASAFRPYVGEVVVIARAGDDAIFAEATRLGLRVVPNSSPEAGMSSSVALAIRDCHTEWLSLCPCDLPLLKGQIVESVVEALKTAEPNGDFVVQPEVEGRRKHPVLLRRAWIEQHLSRLSGGTPLRAILGEANALTVPFDDPLPFRDFDTPPEFQFLLQAGSGEVE
jgi:molybdenum cofactor cytidylyltransferase